MLYEHFWLFCGLWVGIGSVLYGKFKSLALIKNGHFTKQQVNRHLAVFLSCILIPCLLFWLIQQSDSSISSPIFSEWPKPQRFLATSVLLACWALLGIWIFILNGAKYLVDTLILIGNLPEHFQNTRTIKILVVMIITAGVTSLI